MKRATIKDVAALAGVSAATVSRTLEDKPEISPATKRRVREACRQLGYVPNAAAKSLSGQATFTIGLVGKDISNPYFADIATAIEQAALEHGYRVLVSNSRRDAQQELRAVESFLARQIDGILISPSSPRSQALYKDLLRDIPCVYLGANHDCEDSYVTSDNEAGAYMAARYLLSLGHRNILFFGGKRNSRTRTVRLKGFRRALDEEGLAVREISAPPDVGILRQWSYETAMELLKRPLPDAIFAYSDITALKVLEAAEDRGVRIPEDLSLIGYDNISFGALPRIYLTTVSQRKFQQGQLAVERLLEKIRGNREKTVDILQPELVIRATCAPLHNEEEKEYAQHGAL